MRLVTRQEVCAPRWDCDHFVSERKLQLTFPNDADLLVFVLVFWDGRTGFDLEVLRAHRVARNQLSDANSVDRFVELRGE